jgi:hypothetical protein
MDSVKASALKILNSLPDDCTWAEIRERFELFQKLLQGEAEIDSGGGIPNDRVMEEARQWLASSGQPRLVSSST